MITAARSPRREVRWNVDYCAHSNRGGSRRAPCGQGYRSYRGYQYKRRLDGLALIKLEGELTFDIEGEIVVASAGSFVVKPRGVYHAFCNTGTGPNRPLEIHTPGEFETYYDEYEQIVESAMS